MTRRAAASACLLLGLLLLACGKYGPPVRAGAEEKPEPKQSIEIPLPSVQEQDAPDTTAPAPPSEPPSEEEPPPEGAP